MGKNGEIRSTLTADLLAGLTAAIPSIPDAMASGMLAGVSPLFGLYGLMIGTPIGNRRLYEPNRGTGTSRRH